MIRQEVNQSLVDDGLVDLDKIGAANFFWSFPSKVAVAKQNTVDSLEQDIAKVCTDGRQVSTKAYSRAHSGACGSSYFWGWQQRLPIYRRLLLLAWNIVNLTYIPA